MDSSLETVDSNNTAPPSPLLLLILLELNYLSSACLQTSCSSSSSSPSSANVDTLISCKTHSSKPPIFIYDVLQTYQYLSVRATAAECMIKMGILNFIMSFLLYDEALITLKIAKICINFSATSNDIVEQLFQSRCISSLIPSLSSPSEALRRSVWKLLANAAAGTKAHRKLLVKAQLLPLAIAVITTDTVNVVLEVLFFLQNLIVANEPDVLLDITSYRDGEVIRSVCRVIKQPSAPDMLKEKALRIVISILTEARRKSAVPLRKKTKEEAIVYDCGAMTSIMLLQNDENTHVSDAAIQLISQFFANEASDEDEDEEEDEEDNFCNGGYNFKSDERKDRAEMFEDKRDFVKAKLRPVQK
ncbi:uncharacterized protein MONOS_7618 [Monocercomonoides exilis]|uniref:uncharacterized protein n=1 Tax=Monocercomonoides exilis TaxID=2049356 RepID=UPI00355AC445|nr:hypothetical protein MONOS_7618 [Monocercomonoides exilis]